MTSWVAHQPARAWRGGHCPGELLCRPPALHSPAGSTAVTPPPVAQEPGGTEPGTAAGLDRGGPGCWPGCTCGWSGVGGPSTSLREADPSPL